MAGRAKSGLLAVALAGLVALSAAGCAREPSAAAAAMQRTNSWTVPGVLRIGEEAVATDQLDPLVAAGSSSVDISMFWCGYLFDWSDDNQFVPDLAVAVPTTKNGGVSPDGRTITYHLRQGVQWQDGTPFTADDVVFTWHAVLNPRNGVPERVGYDMIERIDEPDDHTAVIHLREPFSPFVATFLTMGDDPYCVLPKHLLARFPDLNGGAFNRMPIGTGPFKVVSNDGKTIKMRANPDYWRGAPGLREVDFITEQSEAALASDLRRGRIDLAYFGVARQTPELGALPGTTTYVYPDNAFTDLGFNMRSAVLRDRAVRQALAYAIDREEIMNTVYNAIDVPARTDQPPYSWAYADGLKSYPYDPAKARQLLEAAGWKLQPDGVRARDGVRLHLVLVALGAPNRLDRDERLLQRYWRDVGVETEIRNYGAGRLYAPLIEGGIEASGRFDVVYESWSKGVDPDDSPLFMCDMMPPAGLNDYRYCNPALDAQERQATASYDVSVRRAAYGRIQTILSQELPMYVLWFQENQDVVNVDLRNYRPASYVTPFWNTWQYRI